VTRLYACVHERAVLIIIFVVIVVVRHKSTANEKVPVVMETAETTHVATATTHVGATATHVGATATATTTVTAAVRKGASRAEREYRDSSRNNNGRSR
jgi:hypothetical protein